MSMTGQQRLEMELARREEIRLAQVQREGEALLSVCERTLADVRDPTVQQLAAADLRQVAMALSTARARITEAPDRALAELGQAQEQLQVALVRGEARAQAWTQQQAEVVGRARAAVQRGGEAAAAQTAVRLAERGDLAQAEALLAAAKAEANSKHEAAVEENVRREVVRGLVRALKDLGFVTGAPAVASDVVVLEGRLASGRKARFEVSLEGKLAFDLDGYEGRACAQDLEKVEVTLRDRFGIRLGPPQVVWKNPDRLSRGARDLPGGSTRKRG